MPEMPANNTCTYEGNDYDCVRDSIVPYMNGLIADGDAASIAHIGDFISEQLIDKLAI
jgi:hypothetical protein